ncbi:MAG: hypothetical protein ACM3H7_03930, partial [Acidobacteriaceae bacterium]
MSPFPLIITIIITSAMGVFTRGRWRNWSLLIASVIFIFWLQPGSPIRHLDFWLPIACLGLVAISWVLTCPKDFPSARTDLMAGLVIALEVMLIGSTRYIDALCCLTPTLPPALQQIGLAMIALILLTLVLGWTGARSTIWIYGFSFFIVGLFIVLKSEPLSRLASAGLRSINDHSAALASGF